MVEQLRSKPRVGRLFFGALLFIAGLTAAISELGGTGAGPAFAVALLIGGSALLAALLVPIRRNRSRAH